MLSISAIENPDNPNKDPCKLIDPMIPLRPKKMPPPPAGTFDPMLFLEEVPEEERNVWDRGHTQLPSIIDTEVFSSTTNTGSPPISPMLVPANTGNRYEPVQIPTVSKVETCKKVMGEKPSPYQTMERMLQLRTFCVVDGNLYVFERSHYQLLSPEAAQRLVVELCRDSVEIVGTPGYPKAVYDLMLIEPRILRHEEEVTNNIVCFQNGALILTTGHLYPHSPTFFTTHCLRCNYASNQGCPNFSVFLAQITGNDPLLIQRVWETIGYCLTPDMGGKIVFLLQGVANSGKSQLSALIGSFFPKDAVTALDVHALGDKFAASELVGKSLCISPDLPSGPLDVKATSVLKQLSGNDLVSADVKYQRRAKFRCTAKFILATNHPLMTKHQDDALVDRLIVIPFRYSVPKEQRDPLLLERFKQEREAIAYQAIQAYYRLVRNHYRFSGDYPINDVVNDNLSNSVKQSTEASIFNFLRNYYCTDPSSGVFVSDAHALFQQHYFPIPLNVFSQVFTQTAKQIYGTIKRRQRRESATNPLSFIEGIALIDGEANRL